MDQPNQTSDLKTDHAGNLLNATGRALAMDSNPWMRYSGESILFDPSAASALLPEDKSSKSATSESSYGLGQPLQLSAEDQILYDEAHKAQLARAKYINEIVEKAHDPKQSDNFTTKEKLWLESVMFGRGIRDGFNATVDDVQAHPIAEVGKLALAVAYPAVCRALQYNRNPLGVACTELPRIMFVLQTAEVVDAMVDTWFHPNSFDKGTATIARTYGEDTAQLLMLGLPTGISYVHSGELFHGARMTSYLSETLSRSKEAETASMKFSMFNRVVPRWEKEGSFTSMSALHGDKVVKINGKNGSGTGFLVDDYIATNRHVARGNEEIEIVTRSGQKTTAKLIASDKADVALLKPASREGMPEKGFDFEDSKLIRYNNKVIVAGHPAGIGNLVWSEGTLTNVGTAREGSRLFKRLKADIPIRPGNSGSPMFNEEGKLLGIVSRADRTHGYAVSSEHIKEMIALAKNNESKDGWLTIKPNETGKVSTPEETIPAQAFERTRVGLAGVARDRFSQAPDREAGVKKELFGSLDDSHSIALRIGYMPALQNSFDLLPPALKSSIHDLVHDAHRYPY